MPIFTLDEYVKPIAFNEDRQRFIIGSDPPGDFKDDTDPEDVRLRVFFRTELHMRNPELYSAFVGGVELRAVVHAAVDDPRPIGETDIFLSRYYRLGYWEERRRGPFPWDMNAWRHRRMDLDEMLMEKLLESLNGEEMESNIHPESYRLQPHQSAGMLTHAISPPSREDHGSQFHVFSSTRAPIQRKMRELWKKDI
ncbi:hypothetical protein BT96DRAFT_993646 [Gymnopus androsaceus JB14]|uniref:Uncharacterized protein n=1 Tax=Gymnopus androsaceus JB14 TaxID=1447944 RepID=A0A6A4HR66_9AGAR|nr:hypothetical protein BT96DRAFT_993646 [Gymnopus androsaceus JB14]